MTVWRSATSHASESISSCESQPSSTSITSTTPDASRWSECWLHFRLRHRAADQVEDFCCDFLLAAFIVGQGEFSDEVLGIV